MENQNEHDGSGTPSKPLKLDLATMSAGELPTDDPLKLAVGPYAHSTFFDAARDYFSKPTGAKQKNLTLEILEAAMNAYVEAKETDLTKNARSLAVTVVKAQTHAFRAEKIAAQVENRFPSLLRELEKLEHRVGDPAAAIEGFKASISESLKLQEARNLWTNAADRAQRAYVGSWIVLVCLLIVVPAIAIWQSDAIFAFFRAIGSAVLVELPANASETAILIAAVSRLVLITLPVALYIWLIRIVVRFNMRSLLLMDDANQRNTMLETYLHLVEQDAGVKIDRPLILEALFRRTPGHGPEAIEPPNLADILKIGVPQSPK